jgi:hypothetical protein
MNRVWVYMSDRSFDSGTRSSIEKDLVDFLAGWNAHGAALSASAEILHDRFIVIRADEEKMTASGCSIDKQFQFVKETEKKYNRSLLNRLLVAYRSGNEIKIVPLSKVPELLATGELSENSIIFNTAVANEEEFRTKFEIPLKESWLAKFLVKVK